MIDMKKRIKFLSVLAALVLMEGCGSRKDELPVKSQISTWICDCRPEAGVLKDTDNEEVLKKCKRMFLPTEQKVGPYFLQDWVDIVEEEKQKDYTILCTDRLYYLLEEKLSEKEQKDFQIYLPALRGEKSLYYTTVTDDDYTTEMLADGKFSAVYSCVDEITINDYCRFLEGLWYEYNWIKSVSLTDLDGDGKKELIICTVYDNRTLVFQEEAGKIYLIDFWSQMYESFEQKWKASHTDEEIRWYAINNEDNIVLSAYDQLEIFAENYKEWTSDKGNHYCYCVYDFNQDGWLELLVMVDREGNDENYFYRVSGNEIEELEQIHGGITGEEANIRNEDIVAFYDKTTGSIYYRGWNFENSNGVESRAYFFVENANVCNTTMNIAEVEKSSNIKKVVSMEVLYYNTAEKFLNSDIVLSKLAESYQGGEY